MTVDVSIVRELLRAAVGDEAAEWPGLPVGAVIGQLTVDQAREAARLADALGDTVHIRVGDDGRPRLVAA